jgi:hypothetical protein
METVELSQQQSLRIAELPEDYLVVGVDRRGPLVRKPTGQIILIQEDGCLTAVTIAVRRGLADHGADNHGRVAGRVRAMSPYTSVSG